MIAKRMLILAGIALAACWASPARAQGQAPPGPTFGTLELSFLGSWGSDRGADGTYANARSETARVGFFLLKNLQVGVGYERMHRNDGNRDYIEPFVKLHMARSSSRLVPFLGVEALLPVDKAYPRGAGLSVGLKYYATNGIVPFVEGRLQARGEQNTAIRSAVAVGAALQF